MPDCKEFIPNSAESLQIRNKESRLPVLDQIYFVGLEGKLVIGLPGEVTK